MATDLDEIVRVVIYDQTAAISTASFQIPLVLSTFTNFSDRARTYTNITQVAEDFATTDKAYIIATKLFGQSGVLGAVPPSIVIGRRQVDEVTITPVLANTQTYTMTINGTEYSYTSDSDATVAEIIAGLIADAGTIPGITFTNNTTNFTVEVTAPGTPWSISVSSNLTKVDVAPTETWVDALEAVEAVNDTWYALVADTQVITEQEALSDAIQAREKIYGLSSSDPAAITTATTDIGTILDAKNNNRTFGVYLPTAAVDYPEAAWMGSQLAVTPGNNDWDYKRANGVTVSKLSNTAKTNLKNKGWNYYTEIAGLNVFQNGDMFGGQYIDVTIGKDWLKARLQEAIFFRMANMLKIPMTNPGLLVIENEIRSVMSLAQANNLIDVGWTISTPPVASIPATMRAQRAAGVFVIRARLAGAVRTVDLEVYLSV